MKDLKFRIGREGEVVYGKFNQSDNNIEYTPNHFIMLDTVWTLMQATGLKDNNNKDIYEGDILKRKTSTPYVVEYNEDYAIFMAQQHYKREKKFWIYLHALATNCEIIGNIYETPELLK